MYIGIYKGFGLTLYGFSAYFFFPRRVRQVWSVA